MATFYQEGRIIDYTPGSAVTAGDVVTLGTFIGVAHNDIPANQKGALGVRGVYIFNKDSGTDFTAGDAVSWDGTKIIASAGGVLHGVVVEDTATGATSVKVDIAPSYADAGA